MTFESDDDKENTKLFEAYQKIIKELRFHAKESNCTHSVPELLDELGEIF